MGNLIRVLLIFSVFQAQAQLNPTVKEDFTSNIRQWEVDEHKTISNGLFVFNTNEDGDQAIINFFIDPHQNFELQSDFIQLGGDEDGGFGLIWGVSDGNYNVFAVSSTGDFAIHSGDPTHMKTWKKSESIKPMNRLNQVKVAKENDKQIGRAHV